MTIISMLKNRVYLGHIVNGKSTTKSFKVRKQVVISPEDWIEVKNTHEPLVDEETFKLAQKVIKVKKQPTKDGNYQIFSGLLKCSTCGHALAYSRQKDRNDNGNFACDLSRRKGKEYCSFHYISYDAINKIILTDLQKQTEAVKKDREAFLKSLSGGFDAKLRKQQADARKEQSKLHRRLNELDQINKKLYKDSALEKITYEQFSSLSSQFSAERNQIQQRLNEFQEQFDKEQESRTNIKQFVKIAEKYLEITELTAPMLNELIEKIVVFDAEKIDGKRTQRVDIYYRFISKI